ncbi:type II secretion system protein [Neptuniibacter sp. QD37_6]|uniref:type II secretion system protein n=1 Tax=Neptuniibacter sp. QD37_6 TaxID=3398210 RepID=UPI0039F4FF2A
MIAQQMKDSIRKFMKADLSQVKDAELRAKGEKLQAKQGGFTLLELLVVVAILAVIAGSVIASLDGKEEGAAQATAVHTMATLESGMRVFNTTEKRLLPAELESLICVDGMTVGADGLSDTLDANTATNAILLSNAGDNSNVSRVHGGLTGDISGKLELVGVSANDPVWTNMVEAGLTGLRYATLNVCDGDVDTAAIATGVDDVALVDVTKPNLIFRDAVIEGTDWEYGAGALIDFTGAASTAIAPIAFFEEPAEIGGEEGDIVAVFGIGPDSSLTNEIIGRAPSDGNVGPDKYGHFSIAVKVAECTAANAEFGDANCDASNEWSVDEDPEVLAVLDAGGDAYDDEIAEAKGNEEE